MGTLVVSHLYDMMDIGQWGRQHGRMVWSLRCYSFKVRHFICATNGLSLCDSAVNAFSFLVMFSHAQTDGRTRGGGGCRRISRESEG